MNIAFVILILLCVISAVIIVILSIRLSSSAAQRARLEERLAQSEKKAEAMQTLHQEMARDNEKNFRLIANEILMQQSAVLQSRNENRLSEILTPLKSDIEKFRKDVTECYSTEARERFSLQERIKELIEVNFTISREAKDLSTALRGNSKMQGDWGEMVLESILDTSGLLKDTQYFIQQQTDENGNALHGESGRGLRPDVVIKYPGETGGVLVIDSKVSLKAFVDYSNAEDPAERKRLGEQHVASVVKHINELSEKRYQDYVGKNRLEFVMMFVPNEAAYAAAMTIDPTLWQRAYDKRVLIVSPTQIIGALRLIRQLWTQDSQSRNAMEIARLSGSMYDKFAAFVEDMEKIDKSLGQARNSYDEAMKKLRNGRGNLLSRAHKLKALGIKTSHTLPQAEDEPEESTENI